eukprot:Tbor_TRINITY_DN5923_c0_g1::TRINITY_DN5923_c0_g1_i1::g.19324::m.19324
MFRRTSRLGYKSLTATWDRSMVRRTSSASATSSPPSSDVSIRIADVDRVKQTVIFEISNIASDSKPSVSRPSDNFPLKYEVPVEWLLDNNTLNMDGNMQRKTIISSTETQEVAMIDSVFFISATPPEEQVLELRMKPKGTEHSTDTPPNANLPSTGENEASEDTSGETLKKTRQCYSQPTLSPFAIFSNLLLPTNSGSEEMTDTNNETIVTRVPVSDIVHGLVSMLPVVSPTPGQFAATAAFPAGYSSSSVFFHGDETNLYNMPLECATSNKDSVLAKGNVESSLNVSSNGSLSLPQKRFWDSATIMNENICTSSNNTDFSCDAPELVLVDNIFTPTSNATTTKGKKTKSNHSYTMVCPTEDSLHHSVLSCEKKKEIMVKLERYGFTLVKDPLLSSSINTAEILARSIVSGTSSSGKNIQVLSKTCPLDAVEQHAAAWGFASSSNKKNTSKSKNGKKSSSTYEDCLTALATKVSEASINMDTDNNKKSKISSSFPPANYEEFLKMLNNETVNHRAAITEKVTTSLFGIVRNSHYGMLATWSDSDLWKTVETDEVVSGIKNNHTILTGKVPKGAKVNNNNNKNSSFGVPNMLTRSTGVKQGNKQRGKHNENHEDGAYKADHLDLHTDSTYFIDSPKVQVFGCCFSDPIGTKGGETSMVDGMMVAMKLAGQIAAAQRKEGKMPGVSTINLKEDLKLVDIGMPAFKIFDSMNADKKMKLLEMLCTVPVGGRYLKEGRHYTSYRPVIALAPGLTAKDLVKAADHMFNHQSPFSTATISQDMKTNSITGESSPVKQPISSESDKALQTKTQRNQKYTYWCDNLQQTLYEGRLGGRPLIERITFNNSDRIPFSPIMAGIASSVPLSERHPTDIHGFFNKPEHLRNMYLAYEWFHTAAHDRSNAIGFTLKVGQLLLFDNHRVLHGRLSFSGPRVMCGSYVGTDEYFSTLKTYCL